MKNNVIYIVASPFQFYVSLLDFYDNKYNCGNIIYLRYANDKNKYENILKKMGLNNLTYNEFKFNEIAMMKKEKIGIILKIKRKLNRLKLIYDIYNENKNLQGKVKIGDRASFEQILLAKLLGEKNIEFIGDGASLVFDRDLKIYLSFLNRLLFLFFSLPNPNQIQTKNYDFFLKKSKFIEDFYADLPVKDEIWLFGQTNYFIKPADLKNYSKYTQEAIKEDKGFDYKDEYFKLLKKIKNKYQDKKIYYFPHRNEIVFNEIKEIFEIANFGYFSEILPIMLGYLPKTIIGTSTTIFSYSKINLHLNKKIELVYYPVTKNINNIYESYGAKNLLEILI